MGWGGARPGAGAPRRSDKARAKPKAPATVPAQPQTPGTAMSVPTMQSIIDMSRQLREMARPAKKFNPFKLPEFPKEAVPKKKLQLAMDEMSWAANEWDSSGIGGLVEEGLVFPGYTYLAELAQRAEYRTFSETISTEMTRKWIKFTSVGEEKEKRRKKAKDRALEPDPADAPAEGDDDDQSDQIKELVDFMEHLQVRDRYAELALQDGLFGRTHLLHDFGEKTDEERQAPVGNGRDAFTKVKVRRGSLKRLAVIEPVWTYPTTYNANNPAAPDWYNPQVWYVMGQEYHCTRLIPFVGRKVPDLLKPAYAFGGLSMTQMAKPYVDIWLNTRQSVADLIHSFSVMVLCTDLQTTMQPQSVANLMTRVAMFNELRDNQGAFVVNKATEDFKNVSASLAGLHELQGQAQEHMMSVARIPAVKFTGMQPQGLNASSEGEIRAFYDTINAWQNKFFRPGLTTTIDFAMITLWGKRNDKIKWDFEPLWEETAKEKGDRQKADGERDQIYVDMGAIAPEEVRKKIIDDPEMPYGELDPDDVPELDEEEEAGLEPEGGRPDPKVEGEPDAGGGANDAVIPFVGARDAWSESDHPRGQPGNAGQFGSGGGGGSKPSKQTIHAPQYGVQHGSFTATGGEPKAPKRLGNVGAEIDPSSLKKIGGQKGSNPGGVYEDDSGKKFYVKAGKTKDHVRNEMIAAALYDLAGTPTLTYRPVKDGTHIATEMEKLDKDNASKLSPDERSEAARDFAVHAWLGNWDAVGLGGDNLGTVQGVPTALDLGGALEYRAQGSPKGKAFGDSVGEIDTLRDPKVNKDSAGVFGAMTPAELRESARYVTSIPDGRIKAAVKKFGGEDALATKLIARKADLAARARLFGAEGDPKKPGSTMVVPTGSEIPVKKLNGVAFDAWEPPEDWATVEGQMEGLQEPEFDAKGRATASGVVIREPDGRVWLVQPRGGFGGYEGTFPKGRVDEGLSMQANAIKEAYEESGLKVRITGFAGDKVGDVTTTRYYTAEREGGDPSKHYDETEGVVLAPVDKASGFLNRKRDRETLAGDEAPFEESKHPRDKGGKFSTTGGGGSGGGDPDVAFKSKKEHAAHLLSKGTTTGEMLAALKWPSISMPQMAKTLGMKLEKIKEGGVTKYKGTPMTKEEVAASKAETAKAKQAKAAQPSNDPPKTFEEFVKKVQDPKTPPADVAGLKKYNPAWAVALEDLKPKPAPAGPPPTAQELEKAKKNVKLQLQFVPGAPQTPAAQNLVNKFNEKYEGKDLTNNPALIQKVHDFKAMQAAMVPLMNAEQQAQAAAQQKAQVQQAEKAKAAAAAAAAEKAKAKKQFDEQHAAVTKELGITDEAELQAFDSFIDHFGGVQSALQKFKSWQSEASSAAKNNPGHGFEKLSGFEMGCIKAYTGPQSGWINQAVIDDSMTPAQYMFEKVLNSALDKLPKVTGKIQRRGLSLDAATHAKLQPGKIWTHRNFASSSDAGWQGNTKLHITTTGKGGAYVAPISSHKGEGETLFKSNLRLFIEKTENKGGILHVHCREM